MAPTPQGRIASSNLTRTLLVAGVTGGAIAATALIGLIVIARVAGYGPSELAHKAGQLVAAGH